MATLLQLIRGTMKVLPVAMTRLGDGKNSPIKAVRVQELEDINVVQVLATQQASGRSGKSNRPSGNTGFYKQVLRFVFENKEDVGNRNPSAINDKCKVNCGCDAQYFYFWWENRRVDAHAGVPYPPYVRKTPPPPEGYPYNNPDHIPGMCKHLVYLVRELRKAKVIE